MLILFWIVILGSTITAPALSGGSQLKSRDADKIRIEGKRFSYDSLTFRWSEHWPGRRMEIKLLDETTYQGRLLYVTDDYLFASPEIIPAVSDSNTFPSSMDISEYAVERLMPSETTLVYSEIDIIFPVGRIRSLLEITSDSTDFTIYWRKLASDVKIYEGAWHFIPSGDQTIVICIMRYRLNVWLPPLIIHGAIHYYFPQIIMTLRQRVNEEP